MDDISDELINELFADDSDEPVFEIRLSPPDEAIERVLRNMDRDMETANNRPSNHHGSNPRRRK
jgi:hypothetical protein